MTTQAQDILRSFEQLADVEKREVASEIIRRCLQLAPPPLSDEELTSLADELFLQCERDDADNARLKGRAEDELVDTYAAQVESAMRAGWNDHRMDEYNGS